MKLKRSNFTAFFYASGSLKPKPYRFDSQSIRITGQIKKEMCFRLTFIHFFVFHLILRIIFQNFMNKNIEGEMKI